MPSFTQTLQQDYSYRQTLVALYGQDTVRLTPRLVMNVGLRWEPTLPSHDYLQPRQRLLAAGLYRGKVSQVFPNGPAGQYFWGDPGVNKSFTSDHWLNLSPRIGFVLDPIRRRQNHYPRWRRSSVRFARNLPYLSCHRPERSLGRHGHRIQRTLSVPQSVGQCPGRQPIPAAALPAQQLCLSAKLRQTPSSSRRLCRPTLETWNLGIQHQFAQNWIATITYIGNETSHLMVGNEINPAVYIPGTWTGAGSCGALTVAPGANGTACSSTGNTQARRFLSLINPDAGQVLLGNGFWLQRHQRQLRRRSGIDRASPLRQLHDPCQLHFRALPQRYPGHVARRRPPLKIRQTQGATTVRARTMRRIFSTPAWCTSATSHPRIASCPSCLAIGRLRR